MPKGWKLVSMYSEKYPRYPDRPIFIDFAHYTGRHGKHGGSDYDKTLSGYISEDTLRRVLRKHLEIGPGYGGSA